MSIKISKEHGINPSICLCPICRNETGIALFGKIKGDIKAQNILLVALYVINVKNKSIMVKYSLLK